MNISLSNDFAEVANEKMFWCVVTDNDVGTRVCFWSLGPEVENEVLGGKFGLDDKSVEPAIPIPERLPLRNRPYEPSRGRQ